MAKKTTPAATSDAETKATYSITDKAPARIAGVRIQSGQKTIDLTEHQARAELLSGHIVPAKPAASASV